MMAVLLHWGARMQQTHLASSHVGRGKFLGGEGVCNY